MKAGFASMEHVQEVSRSEIISVAQAKMKPGGEILTDGRPAYRVVGAEGYEHRYVVLMKDKEGLAQLKWVHTLIANIKGNISGVHHGVASKHMKRCLGKFCYRFNRRIWRLQLFDRTLLACSATSTIIFFELTK